LQGEVTKRPPRFHHRTRNIAMALRAPEKLTVHLP
jgi:hypothetical protein